MAVSVVDAILEVISTRGAPLISLADSMAIKPVNVIMVMMNNDNLFHIRGGEVFMARSILIFVSICRMRAFWRIILDSSAMNAGKCKTRYVIVQRKF